MNAIIKLLALFLLMSSCSNYNNKKKQQDNLSNEQDSSLDNKPPSNKRSLPEVKAITQQSTKFDVEYDKSATTFIAFVKATSLTNNSTLWKTEVYRILYDKDLETDVQETFFKSLSLKGSVLTAIDEKGRTYTLNATTGKLNEISSKRIEPKEIKPITQQSKKFDVEYDKSATTFIAFVKATSLTNNSTLWKTEVYRILYDQDLETDVQETHFESFSLQANTLTAVDEKGNTYRINATNGQLISQ